jgi:chaperonin GroEL
MQIPQVLVNRDQLQKKITHASEILYEMAKAGYGPGSGSTILGFRYGAPMLSKDGVTNIKQVRSTDPFEDDIIQAIKQVSEKNNMKVGDGTTAVVILAHHLLLAAQRMEGKGLTPAEIVAMLKIAEERALKHIEKLKRPIKKSDLVKVATVSAGDAELGMMIADIVHEVGADGGVVIEGYEGLGVHNELIDGFYFPKGYKDTLLITDTTQNQSNHFDVPILISEKSFNTEVDIAPVLDKIVKNGIKELVIIGEVNGAALEILKMSKAKGILMGVPVDPPYTVGGRTLFLDDIALMCGATVYGGVNFTTEQLGSASEVLVTASSTTVLGGDSETEAVKERVQLIRTQLEEEDSQQSVQFAKDRLARLTNKMAIIKVGGAIEFERDEVKLRVQDAVCAVQSALRDGILPGGAVALATVSDTDFDDAFKQPFKQLVSNCGQNAEALLAHVEAAEPWFGYDLRNITAEPVNLIKQGIVDPSLVVKEIITNAVSVVSGLITANAATAYKLEAKE